MPSRIVTIAMCLAATAASQDVKHLDVAATNTARPLNVTAGQIVRGGPYPSDVHATGQVQIKIAVCLRVVPGEALVCDGYMIMRADDAIVHEATGEIDAHGNVSLTPLLHDSKTN